MPIVTKTSVKSHFETGDKPTEAQFSEWIDSQLFIPHSGGTALLGVIEVVSTASSITHPSGTFGIQIISAETTASAQGHLGAGTVGIQIISAETTASAQDQMALGTSDNVQFNDLTCAVFTSNGFNDDATAQRLKITNSSMLVGDPNANTSHTVYRGRTDSSLFYSGGSGVNFGANLGLNGELHATVPNQIKIRQGTTNRILVGHTDGNSDIIFSDVSGVATITISGSSGHTGFGAIPSGNFQISIVGDKGAITANSTDNLFPTIDVRNSHASFAAMAHRIRVDRVASSAWSMASWYSNTGSDLEFKFSGDGDGTCEGAWTGGGADYAEWFEWLDGNPSNESRDGLSVVLDGDKIRPALVTDAPADIIGVVSTAPALAGDGDIDRWKNKYLKDDYGRHLQEEYTVTEWTETVPAVTDEDGDVVEGETTKQHSYASDQIPEGITVPAEAVTSTHDGKSNLLKRRVINPAYDPALEYVSRDDRPEWVTIGLMGKLRVNVGQPTGDRWIKMRDVSATVEEWMVL